MPITENIVGFRKNYWGGVDYGWFRL
jgi:hypothetical protein